MTVALMQKMSENQNFDLEAESLQLSANFDKVSIG